MPKLKKPRKAAQLAPAMPSVIKPVQQDPAQQQVEKLPSVEWGDRLDSGKAIARGGKETGHVPGAMPSR